ncbi:hypothetical protein Q8F55_006783 [Vanrija albida]|uniref:ENTH domain-containing protein n=1 Tax=Vanrija albida TaxID=181172 RepID=A0ABR3PY31_9TREE
MAQSLQHFGRGALRVAKNYTKGYTDTQTKVRDSTSNDPWGPSGTQMNEIAQLTYNQSDFVEIMEMLDKRLNDKGKNWRHVFKALTVLDYCLHAGSENVVIYFKDNLYIIKTLKEFVYVDDQGKDVGHNVRQKAKDITNLLQDEERLRSERRSRGAMRDRMLGNLAESGLRGEDDYGGPRRRNSSDGPPPPSRPQPTRSRTTGGGGGDDDELQRALQASIDSNNDEQRRRTQTQQEEDDLRKALRLSEEEEARKKREAEEATKNALMDDNFQLESNNLYQQQQQVDLFAQQPTGFQLVDVSNPWGQQQLQPQYTSYNPFHAQMLAQQQQQQQEELLRQQQLLQQQQQQEYLRQQQLLQQQQTSLLPQPTGYGSNNPFAPKPPQRSLLDPQPGSSFNNSFLPVPQATTPQTPSPGLTQDRPFTSQQPLAPSSPAQTNVKPAWQAPVKTDDGKNSDLANLIGRGREDGLDTFGNVGNLRVPTGSVFHQSNRVAVQQTGLQPQATGFGANNPFGRPPQQQQQQQNSDQPFFSI